MLSKMAVGLCIANVARSQLRINRQQPPGGGKIVGPSRPRSFCLGHVCCLDKEYRYKKPGLVKQKTGGYKIELVEQYPTGKYHCCNEYHRCNLKTLRCEWFIDMCPNRPQWTHNELKKLDKHLEQIEYEWQYPKIPPIGKDFLKKERKKADDFKYKQCWIHQQWHMKKYGPAIHRRARPGKFDDCNCYPCKRGRNQ